MPARAAASTLCGAMSRVRPGLHGLTPANPCDTEYNRICGPIASRLALSVTLNRPAVMPRQTKRALVAVLGRLGLRPGRRRSDTAQSQVR